MFNSPQRRPLPDPQVGRRLGWAVGLSLAVNAGLWSALAAVAHRPHAALPPVVEVTRLVLPVTVPKVEAPKQVPPRAAPVKPVQTPAPPRRAETPRAPVQPRVASQPQRTPVQPRPAQAPRPSAPTPQPATRMAQEPQGAHNRVLTAPGNDPPSSLKEFATLPGGNAAVGRPLSGQNNGNAETNPDGPVTKRPVAPAPPPPPPTPPPATGPKEETPSLPPPPPPPKVELPKPNLEPRVLPKVENPLPKPEPPKPEPPRPKGPSRSAEPVNTVQPRIPDGLRSGEFKGFVRVKVEIEADGSFTPVLRTSSGNPEIDERVLEALRRWRWKPALRDGEPVKSTELFKFEFEVR